MVSLAEFSVKSTAPDKMSIKWRLSVYTPDMREISLFFHLRRKSHKPWCFHKLAATPRPELSVRLSVWSPASHNIVPFLTEEGVHTVHPTSTLSTSSALGLSCGYSVSCRAGCTVSCLVNIQKVGEASTPPGKSAGCLLTQCCNPNLASVPPDYFF